MEYVPLFFERNSKERSNLKLKNKLMDPGSPP